LFVHNLTYYHLLLQNTSADGVLSSDDAGVCKARYQRRLQLMLRALLAISGEAMRQRFMSQQLLVKVSTIMATNK
jgi:phosphatidylinositol-4-phosphate 3-kinase